MGYHAEVQYFAPLGMPSYKCNSSAAVSTAAISTAVQLNGSTENGSENI